MNEAHSVPQDGEDHCHGGHAAHGHGGHGDGGGSFATSARATLHCLTGCVIGEVAGLSIGVSLGFAPWQTIVLATALAYLSGFALGLLPVMRDRGLGFGEAFRLIWIGETVSIGVMEFAMNFTDYHMGGMTAGSILSWTYVAALLVAIPAGFLAAWPVNYWLLRRNLKACH